MLRLCVAVCSVKGPNVLLWQAWANPTLGRDFNARPCATKWIKCQLKLPYRSMLMLQVSHKIGYSFPNALTVNHDTDNSQHRLLSYGIYILTCQMENEKNVHIWSYILVLANCCIITSIVWFSCIQQDNRLN